MAYVGNELETPLGVVSLTNKGRSGLWTHGKDIGKNQSADCVQEHKEKAVAWGRKYMDSDAAKML